MSNPEDGPPAAQQVVLQLACVGCIQERKLAEMDGKTGDELPEVEIAVTLMGGTAVCYGHIVVQRMSPLMQPNGQGLPPGLRRPN